MGPGLKTRDVVGRDKSTGGYRYKRFEGIILANFDLIIY